MIRKAIGAVLIVIALGITLALVTGGGTIVPHIIGPIVLVTAGVLLLTYNRKAIQPAE